jgi:hypothetical protein
MRAALKSAVLTAFVFLMFVMPLTVPLFKSSAEYSVFNPGWEGLSKFGMLLREEGKNPIPLLGPLDSYHLSGGTLVIVGPDVDYTPDEIKAIREFVKNGNTLFLADDFGTGNEILKGLGVRMGLSRYPLRDFFYEVDDRFVIAVRIDDPVLGKNVISWVDFALRAS